MPTSYPTRRASELGSAMYRLTRMLETYVARRADAVAVICEGLRSDLSKRAISADKIMVSPNGVDLDLFGDPPPPDQALAAQLSIEGSEVIGFIGSFYDRSEEHQSEHQAIMR